MRRRLSRGLSLGLIPAAAGLLSGCYPAQPALYSPGSQYYAPQYYAPQYSAPGYPRPAYPEARPAPQLLPPPDARRDTEPPAAPYDTRPAEPFSPTTVEPSPPPAAADDDAFLLPKVDSRPGDTPSAPPKPGVRTGAPASSVPLMGFRPMRGQQGL